MPTRRNAELGLLAAVMVVLVAYSAANEAGFFRAVTGDFWVLPALFGIVLLVAHLVVRIFAPYADPIILPLVGLVNGIGILFLRRWDVGNARDYKKPMPGVASFSGSLGFKQVVWTMIAVALFALVIILVKDHRAISRYAYTLGFAGLVFVTIPAVLPASLSEIYGAKLWIKLGPFQIQPGEFAKIALLCFFAYYLVRKREVLSLASKRFLGIDFPRGRDLGPVVAVWIFSMLVLIFEKDLGTALMYFGIFVVTLYIATERVSWVIIGLGLFAVGAVLAHALVARLQLRVFIWLHPFEDPLDKGYQLVQGLLGLGTGGLFGAGPGAGQPTQVPEVYNDFIFAGLGEEIGLFGLTAMLAFYLIIVERGLRAAVAVRDSFGKLLAGGIAFSFGLQVFVIVGGVSGLIPLTGQTTPFLSAGGSSLMANWMMVALLLRISDAARRPVTGSVSTGSASSGAKRPPDQLRDAPTEVVRL